MEYVEANVLSAFCLLHVSPLKKMTEPGVVEDISPQGLSQKQLSCSLTSSWNGILFGEGTFWLYDTQILNETGLFTIIYLQNWVVLGGKCRVNIPYIEH